MINANLGNNGNQFADILNDLGLLKDGMTCQQAEEAYLTVYGLSEQQKRWLRRNDFWEDFCYRCIEELKINIAL